MNTSFICSLPDQTNDGASTLREQALFINTIFAARGNVRPSRHATGMWYDDNGTLYQEPVTRMLVTAPEAVVRQALAVFGRNCDQLAMLMVPVQPRNAHIAGEAYGLIEAQELAKRFGGATLLASGIAESYVYAGLEQGKDY